MKRVVIITGRHMASVENEADKMAQTLRQAGAEVSIEQFDRQPSQAHYDLAIWWTPMLGMFIVHQKKWLNIQKASLVVSYYVIEGRVHGIYVWKKWLSWQHIAVPSAFAKSVIEKEGITVKEVIPHQIPAELPIDNEYGLKWRNRFPSNKKIFLYNGSQILRKALPKLIEASNILSRHRDDFLTVFHTDNYNFAFHTPAKDIHGKNIVLETEFPHLPIQQAYAKMAYSDFIVHPAKIEGFGLPCLEALNLGKPLICINAPGVNEIATPKNSFMVTDVQPSKLEWSNYITFECVDYSAQRLAEQMELALDSKPEVLEEKRLAGLETAKRYYNTYDRFTQF